MAGPRRPSCCSIAMARSAPPISGGSAFYLETGMEALRALINEGIRAVLRTAEVSRRRARLRLLWPAGARRGRTDRGARPVARSRRWPAERYTLRQRHGLRLGRIAGLRRRHQRGRGHRLDLLRANTPGRSARCGGWGELFSDEGSAYWIARSGLTLVLAHERRSRASAGRCMSWCASASANGATSSSPRGCSPN